MRSQTTPIDLNKNGGAIMQDRIIRISEAVTITGRSKSSLMRDEKSGIFPRRIRTGKY